MERRVKSIALHTTALPFRRAHKAHAGGEVCDALQSEPQGLHAGFANEYWPDNTGYPAWILGRVKKTTTTSTVPNSLTSTAASAGAAPKATATTGP